MKILMSISLIISIMLIGCGQSNIGRKYDFVEPNAVITNSQGYLKIFTVSTESRKFADDPTNMIYKGYTIYSQDGDYIMHVEKSEKPKLVKLEEGEYIVVAEFQKNIVHSFLVQIEKGKILEVDKSMLEIL